MQVISSFALGCLITFLVLGGNLSVGGRSALGRRRRMQPQPRDTLSSDVSMYVAQARLMTAAEQRFYGSLQRSIPSSIHVFAQVRVANIVGVDAAFGRDPTPFYRIQGKCVDFVLCCAKTSRIALVIELDDASHDAPDRKERDAFVDAVMAQARIPMLHIRCCASYDETRLRKAIHKRISR